MHRYVKADGFAQSDSGTPAPVPLSASSERFLSHAVSAGAGMPCALGRFRQVGSATSACSRNDNQNATPKAVLERHELESLNTPTQIRIVPTASPMANARIIHRR